MTAASSTIESVLVTGGGGFVGAAILAALHGQHLSWTLYSFDLQPAVNPHAYVTYLTGNVLDRQAVEAALTTAHATVVVHTAGTVPPLARRYDRSPRARGVLTQINVQGTENVLVAAKTVRYSSHRSEKESGEQTDPSVSITDVAGNESINAPSRQSTQVKAFIYTSSVCAVIDDPRYAYPCINETWHDAPAAYGTAYGSSKSAADAIVLAADDPASGFRTCSLRPSVLFGPGDPLLVPSVHACIAKGEMPFVIGHACNLWDATDVRNVAHAHRLAVDNLLGLPTPSNTISKFVYSENEKTKQLTDLTKPGLKSQQFESTASQTRQMESKNSSSSETASEKAKLWQFESTNSTSGESPTIHSKSTRPSASNAKPRSAGGQIILIANEAPITFRDFCRAVWREFDAYPAFEVHIPESVARIGVIAAGLWSTLTGTPTTLVRGAVDDAVAVRYIDGTKARDILGYEPVVGFEQGLKESCRDYAERMKAAEKNPLDRQRLFKAGIII